MGISQGYHGANMGYDDDDSINTIGKNMTKQVNSVTRAHNTNSQVTSEGMTALRAEGVRQAQELAQLRVEMANLLQQTHAPAVSAYTPVTIPAPVYSPVPPAPDYSLATTGGGGKSRKGRNNRAAYAPTPPAVYNPMGPPSCGNQAIPLPAKPAGNRSNPVNPVNPMKHFNNWNNCYSCGGDVPSWHTSTTCPVNCQKSHHQAG